MDAKVTHKVSEIVRKSITEHEDFTEWSVEEVTQGLSLAVAGFLRYASAMTKGKVEMEELWEHFKTTTDVALVLINHENKKEPN